MRIKSIAMAMGRNDFKTNMLVYMCIQHKIFNDFAGKKRSHSMRDVCDIISFWVIAKDYICDNHEFCGNDDFSADYL